MKSKLRTQQRVCYFSELNEEDENIKSAKKSEYLSPSLEILDSNNALAKKKLDKENIKANSDLLERVFQD